VPASVSTRARVLRSRSLAPTSRSSHAIRLLTAGCEVPSSRATAVKLPVSTARRKLRIAYNAIHPCPPPSLLDDHMFRTSTSAQDVTDRTILN
jgi:hypothetical protein